MKVLVCHLRTDMALRGRCQLLKVLECEFLNAIRARFSEHFEKLHICAHSDLNVILVGKL